MISPKSHTRCLLIGGLTLIGLLALVASCLAGDERESAGSEERLRALLTERYDILKQRVASVQVFLEHGRADLTELGAAMTDMYHAEADLCTTDAERIKVYEKLVDTLKTHEEWAARREATGRIGEGLRAKARVATINAQIDLERLRLGQHLPAR
jgi:hypothetical protein